MLKLERKYSPDGKGVIHFSRVFDSTSGIVVIMDLDDSVEITKLLLEDFSDFHLSEVLRQITPQNRLRLWEELWAGYRHELPEAPKLSPVE